MVPGKSTVLDAVDFALTGTINKFSVKAAKGGGLDEHIWWVGSGKAETHSVSIGFVNDAEERFIVTRSRENGCTVQPSEILTRLCSQRSAHKASVETLLQTTLIRDEFIAGLSLDLPEQTRFTLVREAIGSMVGPDYSPRQKTIKMTGSRTFRTNWGECWVSLRMRGASRSGPQIFRKP
jgi:chromosome segregation protein